MTITKRSIIINNKNYHTDITKVIAFNAERFNKLTGDLEFDMFETSPEKSFRLVYNSNKALIYFESEGVTVSIYEIFAGTEKECQAQAEKLQIELPKLETAMELPKLETAMKLPKLETAI